MRITELQISLLFSSTSTNTYIPTSQNILQHCLLAGILKGSKSFSSKFKSEIFKLNRKVVVRVPLLTYAYGNIVILFFFFILFRSLSVSAAAAVACRADQLAPASRPFWLP